MIQLWWKSILWAASLGITLWFIALLLIPLYGLLRPWPRAQERLRGEGIAGYPLMIGGGSDGEHRSDSSGEHWRKEKQRSYVVFPDSFRRNEIFTYSESEGSGIAGVHKEVLRSRSLIPLALLWILAGFFTARKVLRFIPSTKAKMNLC